MNGIDRRVLLAGGGAAVALGLWRARVLAAETLGYAAPPDFGLTGALTQGGWARGLAPAGTLALSLSGKPVMIARDGRFFIAFDRDSPPILQLTAQLSNGRSASRSIAVAPRGWQLERIAIGPKPGTPPSEAYARLRSGELAQINAARSVDHPIDGWRQRFIWPVYGRLSGKFGSQRIYNGMPGSYHSGLDIATGASGTPFVAPADGIVTLAAQSPFSLEGKLLMIDHGMGLNSAFLHCSAHAVQVGAVVRQGQFIANIGKTGRATGPHLHWSIKWRDFRLDPLLFAGPMG